MKLPWPFARKEHSIPHPGGGSPLYYLRNLDVAGLGGEFDYGRRVGIGTKASVVMAPIQWVQRSMPEAPVVIEKQTADGEWEGLPDHPLAALLDQPNPFYSGLHLWQATCFSFLTDGNAYWIAVANGLGRPVELWFAPHWLIKPVGSRDGTQFLTHYEYRVSGKVFELPPDQVVHFRHGINPENPRLGMSPLESALREIWTDMEAAEFIATLLRNNGVPGLILSPGDGGVTLEASDADEIKNYVMERTTGSSRGEPIVMSGPSKVDRLSWSPKEMDLSPATDRSEERVCALLGIPAAVVGFSAGLEQTKVGATMKEMRELAWRNGIIPLHRNFEGEMNRQLLPKFGNESGRRRTRFDASEIAALQDDRNDLIEQVDRGIQGGWLTVAEGKRMVGIDPEPADEIYLRRIAVVAVPKDAAADAPSEPEKDAEEIGLKEDDPTGLESSLIETAPRAEATAAQLAFQKLQDASAEVMAPFMAAELKTFFASLSQRAEDEAEPILAELFKQSVEAGLATERILDAMNMPELIPIFRELYEVHYLRVATEGTAEAMGTLGLATDIPDPVARAVQATGGTRAGLIDLTEQTKRAVFTALEEGRALGEGAGQLAKRIASLIERGPWSSAEVRAQVIARTETKHAQRLSVLHLSEGQGVREFRVFDARLGLTDATCTALDGIIVSASDAEHLAGDEHPNGSRDFVPHFG